MILNDVMIRKLILEKQLVSNYKNLDIQIQTHGFDLTVKQVYEYVGFVTPIIDFSNELRKLSRYKKLFLSSGRWKLNEGSYKIEFNEVVKLPSDMVAIGIHRSSIIRCDCDTAMGYWDAGYNGRGVTRLTVGRQGLILFKDARVTQLIFLSVDEAEHIYSGKYQHES